jgi:hypothetical protein
MLTLTLGLLVSAGIVMALVLDWVKHPDLFARQRNLGGDARVPVRVDEEPSTGRLAPRT